MAIGKPPAPRTKEEHNRLRLQVLNGEVPDPSPHGFGGDWCPWCFADWKEAHRPECVSPFRDDPPGGGLLGNDD